MKKLQKINKAIALYRTTNKRKMFNTIRAVYNQYGLNGLKLAISNKINDRSLLSGLYFQNLESDGFNAQLIHSYDLDLIGEGIFNFQQSEYGEDDFKNMIDSMKVRPLISVVMPVYNPQIKWLKRAIESLQKQYYTNWELCAVDDGSKDRRGCSLIEEFSKMDSRVRLIKLDKNYGISIASNVSLEMSNGEYIALLDQDDEITLDAFYWVAKNINEEPEVEFIYSDECKISVNERHSYFFKPDWSPLLMVNYMYSGHLSVYKKEIIKKVGGFRSEFDFSQDYDLALRVGEIATRIKHIERVLYMWRTLPTSGSAGGKDFARISNMLAIFDWYKRNGILVTMEKREKANYGRSRMNNYPKVSIVIPTDSYDNLKRSIQGLLTQTSYPNVEIVPVTNSLVSERIKLEYPYLDFLNVCDYNKIYNFSDKCNNGARLATGEIIIFYNDDVYPVSRDWVERQIEILQYPNVGGVSPLLIHEDKTIQYAGMITGTPGLIGTSFNGRHYLDSSSNAYNHLLLRDVTILSGAVLTVKKEIFFDVGGFDADNTPDRHSDLDLSLKLIEKGYRCAYTPYSILTHIGNHSWEKKDIADKADIYCIKRWGNYLATDRYFTDSMKRMFYRDFGYRYSLYCPNKQVQLNMKKGKNILFISHELSRTGAPVVLKDMVKSAMIDGDFPVVLSPVDGPLKQEYLDMGVTVIIDESFVHGHWMFENFARNFDMVVINTLACGRAVALLEDSLPTVIWWIHEGSFAIEHFRHLLPRKVGKKVMVYCVSKYTLERFQGLNIKCNADILNYGVEDFADKIIHVSSSRKLKFLLVGSYESRKGQDILVKAIKIIESKYSGKAEYLFIGNILDEDIFNEVEQLSRKNKNVIIMDPMSRDELFKIYDEITCFVSASRDDPMPVVLAEGMMLSKICLCSDRTGTASYIRDGYNGFVFESENADDLAKKMSYIIENRDDLLNIRCASREIYDQYFSMEVFHNNFIKLKNGS